MDSLALRYKLKILVQFTRDSDKKIMLPTQFNSFLSQRNIYKTDKIIENINIIMNKFDYIFENSSNRIDLLKWPILINFYKKKLNTEIFILSPFNSEIMYKMMDERNREFRKSHKKFKKFKRFKRNFLLSSIIFFKINLIKNFFFSENILLYKFKKNLFALGGTLISLKNRPKLKKQKINFRRKLRYDSEGRVVNL